MKRWSHHSERIALEDRAAVDDNKKEVHQSQSAIYGYIGSDHGLKLNIIRKNGSCKKEEHPKTYRDTLHSMDRMHSVCVNLILSN